MKIYRAVANPRTIRHRFAAVVAFPARAGMGGCRGSFASGPGNAG